MLRLSFEQGRVTGTTYTRQRAAPQLVSELSHLFPSSLTVASVLDYFLCCGACSSPKSTPHRLKKN